MKDNKKGIAGGPQKKENGRLLKTRYVALRISKRNISTQRLKLAALKPARISQALLTHFLGNVIPKKG